MAGLLTLWGQSKILEFLNQLIYPLKSTIINLQLPDLVDFLSFVMIESIIFNNEVLEFERPNNLNVLKLSKIKLRTQLSLLQDSLKHSSSADQTHRIKKTEIAPIKAQVKGVNLAIKRFYSLEKKSRIEPAKHQPKILKEFKDGTRVMSSK